jgi:hypothetical protein
MSTCPDCGSDFDDLGIDHLRIDPSWIDPLWIDNCHGTLVVHSDRSMDCTDPGCTLPELLRHDLIIDCMAVLGGCCVAEEGAHVAEAS